MSSVSLTDRQIKALDDYVSILHVRFSPQLIDVLLFGSAARGDANASSDIDVAVLLDHPTAKDLADARGMAFDIWLSHGVLLSIRAMSRRSWDALADMHSLYLQNLQHDGISLLKAPVPLAA